VLQDQGKFDEAEKTLRRSIAIGKELDDERHLAKVLNSLGGVLQRQNRFDEAEKAFRDSIEIDEKAGNERGLAMTLNSFGWALQRQNRFDEAEKAFRDSIEIDEELDDKHGLAMTLNRLGGVLHRQGHFDEAKDTIQRSYDMLVEMEDQRGQAMTLNSLGGVLQRQRKFAEADEAFRRSIEIGELGGKQHLAIAHAKRGESLRAWGKFEKAAAELCESFRINESLKNRRGMDLVTQVLIKTLLKLGRADEALDYCQRALEIAPTSSHLLKLRDQLSSPKKISHGTIKRVIPNRRYLYGFITTDDGDADIYFREGYVGSVSLSDLSEGVRVEVAFEHDPIGRRRATNIRLIV
jgi:tetratricopeptide (TPR) repeat protein